MSGKLKTLFCCVFAFALVLRLCYAIFTFASSVENGDGKRVPTYIDMQRGDMPTYIVPAYYLFETGSMKYCSSKAREIGIDDRPNTSDFGKTDDGKLPKWGFMYEKEQDYIRRLPIYPLFCTIIPMMPSYESGLAALILLQCVLDSITAALIFLICNMLIKKETYWKLLPSFVYAINFSAIFCCCRALTDILFSFLLTVSVFLFLKTLECGYAKRALYWLTATLIVSSAALLTRPVGLVLFGAMGLVLGVRGIVNAYKHRALTDIVFDWSMGICISVVLFAVYFGWSYRNYSKIGEFNFEPTYAINKLFYKCAPYIAARDKISVDSACYRLYSECCELGIKKGIDFKEKALNQYPSIINEVAKIELKNHGILDDIKYQFILGPVYLVMPEMSFFNSLGLYDALNSNMNKTAPTGNTGFIKKFVGRISNLPVFWIFAFVLYMASVLISVFLSFISFAFILLRKLKLTYPLFFVYLVAYVQFFGIGVASGSRYIIPCIGYMAIIAACLLACIGRRNNNNASAIAP